MVDTFRLFGPNVEEGNRVPDKTAGPTEEIPAAAAALEVPIAGVPTYCVGLDLEVD